MSPLKFDELKLGMRVRCIHPAHRSFGTEGVIIEIWPSMQGIGRKGFRVKFDDFGIGTWHTAHYFEEILDKIINEDAKCSGCNSPAPHTNQKDFECAVCKTMRELQ